jgi:hypothetical protein
MNISRHAKNNMRLYGVNLEDIRVAIQSPDFSERKGDRITAHKTFPNRFSGYPLKIVYEEKDDFFVITVYPLKKTYRRSKK